MTRWSILPAYLVRTAGFAFDRLAPLRCSRSAAAAEALDDAAAARLAAGRALDEALSQERYAENPAFDDPATRKVLSRHVKHARAFARQLPDAAPATAPATEVPVEALREVVRVVPKVAALADALAAAHAHWQDLRRTFAEIFAADFEQARVAIRRLYRDDLRLQEAVFLESPEAFERISQLIATDGPRNVRARQRERLAIMYAQRFCAKNDTNSICGPHGVAYLTDDADSGAADAARIGIVTEDARRETYFSHWAAQRLLDEAVRRAGEDPDAGLAAITTFRLHPAARVEDGAVAWCVMDHDATTSFRRRYARSALPPAGARLLRAMSRPRSGAELAALAGELELGADEIAGFVDDLVGAGIVLRGPVLPPGLFHPLRAVAAEVERWAPSDARTWALVEVEAVEALLAAFARAALPTGSRCSTSSARGSRRPPAARRRAARAATTPIARVLHEDCYVEVRSELGEARAALDDAVPALVAALELPLELARERVREWFRARFGAGVRVPALEVHRAFDDDCVLEAPAATPRAAALRTAMEHVRDALGAPLRRPPVVRRGYPPATCAARSTASPRLRTPATSAPT